MPTVKQISLQEANEERFNRKHIDGYIRAEIAEHPEIQTKIDQGAALLEKFRSLEYSYESKNKRMQALQDLDMRALVEEIFVGMAYFRKPELLSSVVPQLAGRLGFDDKRDAATTMAEMIAVLGHTYAYAITKENEMASIFIQSNLPLSDKLNTFIDNSRYLPPMVCKPLKLEGNYDSGYLTHRDSLLLGKGNHHDGDICLDVLNLMNSVALKLDEEFLSIEEEAEPDWEEVTQEKLDNWKEFKEQSYYFYALLAQQGNTFYMTHKVDKRGRIYSQGYHINPQGASFKKAMIELKNEEHVTGIPAHLMTL